MRNFAAMLVVSGFAVSSSLGAVVTFQPVTPGGNIVQEGAIPASIEFETWVLPETSSFANQIEAFNILIGSSQLDIDSFAYTQDFITAAGGFLTPPTVVGTYPSDLFVGGFTSDDRQAPAPLGYLLGTVSVSFQPGTAGVGMGDYNFGVDSVFDGDTSSIGRGDFVESIRSAGGVVSVVPEPATLGLLALGTLSLIRRRRTA